jgi:NADH-quinone oxidoreductase subunit L
MIAFAPSVAGLLGILVAWVAYISSPALPASLAKSFRPLYLFLLNKWYFDELYDVIFVRPYQAIARFLWRNVDEDVIEKMPMGAARLTFQSAIQAARTQTGSIAVYAFTTLIGLVLLISTIVFLG